MNQTSNMSMQRSRKRGPLMEHVPERPLSHIANFSLGSRHNSQLVEFIAGKRSVKFRFLEAAIHHRVLTPRSCHSLALSFKGRLQSRAVS